MNFEKNAIITEIKKLSNLLDAQYNSELNFRNHCYLRIAYDCALNNKWDLVVNKPFVNNADIKILLTVQNSLRTYINDKKQLLTDNEKSLYFRKKAKELKPPRTNTLF